MLAGVFSILLSVKILRPICTASSLAVSLALFLCNCVLIRHNDGLFITSKLCIWQSPKKRLSELIVALCWNIGINLRLHYTLIARETSLTVYFLTDVTDGSADVTHFDVWLIVSFCFSCPPKEICITAPDFTDNVDTRALCITIYQPKLYANEQNSRNVSSFCHLEGNGGKAKVFGETISARHVHYFNDVLFHLGTKKKAL